MDDKLTKSLLEKLNSLTKYPSIPTLHALSDDGKGHLTDALNVDFGHENLIATEKIDGTNARIVLLSPQNSYRSWLIGSRTEWLTAEDDLIVNPKLGICEALQSITGSPAFLGLRPRHHITVLYGEVYGGHTTKAATQYTSSRRLGFRLFDVAHFHERSWEDQSLESIAAWRDKGGQHFVTENELQDIADYLNVEVTPRLDFYDISDPTADLSHARILQEMDASLPHSKARMDGEAMGMRGAAEGIVVRTRNRSKIAKLHFKRYRRALRRDGKIR